MRKWFRQFHQEQLSFDATALIMSKMEGSEYCWTDNNGGILLTFLNCVVVWWLVFFKYSKFALSLTFEGIKVANGWVRAMFQQS